MTTTAPDSTVTTQTWDAAGDVVQTTAPGGLVLNYEYDDTHRLLITKATGTNVDPMDPTAHALTLESRTYDPVGRLTDIINAMGRTISYTYYDDNLLNAATVARTSPTPDLVTEQRTYDATGHPIAITTAASAITTTYAYDPAGNVATQALDPAGLNRVNISSYNADSSIHTTTFTGAASLGRTERVDFTYDAAGRVLTTTTDNTGSTPAALTTTITRDPRGLVTTQTDPTGITSSYTYDANGQLVTTTDAARTTWVAGLSGILWAGFRCDRCS